MSIDASAFNFDAMKEVIGQDPFATTNAKFAKDERFYTLSKDKEGNGAALIRFLPDSEKGMIQRMFRVNTTIIKNGKKRFVNEFSPSTIGQPCPFQEKWQDLWNAGDKEGARQFGRATRYVTNIKVIKDPANPENEGKIFLYEMSGSMKDKIQAIVSPSEQDKALGAEPKQLFNPFQGNSFRLVCKKGSNGMINYDSSEIVNEVNAIYGSIEEGLEDIKNNTYKLSDLLKPESFLSYEQLQEKMKYVTFANESSANTNTQPLQTEVAQVQPQTTEVQPAVTQVAQVTQTPQAPMQEEPKKTAPTTADSLDDLLSGLV